MCVEVGPDTAPLLEGALHARRGGVAQQEVSKQVGRRVRDVGHRHQVVSSGS